MNFRDYINGERFGKEAQELEREAMNDPFLQDAIDGYDLINDNPAGYLKEIKKQIRKRTNNNTNYLQWGAIAACILLFICLSIFFFLQDTDNKAEPIYVEVPVNETIESVSYPHIEGNNAQTAKQQSKDLVNNRKETINQKEDRNQLERDWYYGEDRDEEDERTYNQRQIRNREQEYEESNNYYSLSDSEIRSIFSNYERDERATNSQQTIQTVREETLNEYIDKNRRQLTDNDCANQHGTVVLMYKVNAQGRPTDISVLRSLCAEADREAVRLLQNGPNLTANSNFTRLEIAF